MKKHKHRCIKCKRTWVCIRPKMTPRDYLACGHEGGHSHWSICDKCFDKLANTIPDSFTTAQATKPYKIRKTY